MIQIPLNIRLTQSATFENFLPGENREALSAVRDCVLGRSPRALMVCGAHGTGKSHLMQAAAHAASQAGLSVAYLPLHMVDELSPQLLDGLESHEMVIADDVDRIAKWCVWEQAFFEFYNRLEIRGGALLLAATRRVVDTSYQLADLQSRLSAAPSYQLRALSDSDRRLAIKRRAIALGFELTDEVCEFLFRRSARDMHTLSDLLVRIERLSLVEKRKVTVPLVRAVLSED